MIEKVVKDYLDSKGLPAYVGEPDIKPVTRHVIYKSNHRITDTLNSATIIIWSYGDSQYHACEADELLRNTMSSITELTAVSSCKLENSFGDNLTTSKEFRYRSEFDVVFL